MIYTFTANPSIDYIMNVPRFQPGELVRSSSEHIVPGGKGLNVATVLKSFGIETRNVAVLAGDTGKDWLNKVHESGLEMEAVWLESGMTRVNVKLMGIEQTEINAVGPTITDEDMAAITKKLKSLELPVQGDTVVLSGSILTGMPDTVFADIIGRMAAEGVKVILDTAAASAMRCAIAKHPYLIKPNVNELKLIANTAIDTEEDVINCAERLIRMGVQNVLVSLGKDGAIWVGEDGFKYKAFAPQGREKNSVGCGDSMVAAFIAGQEKGLDIKECIHLAVATGSAGAFSENLPTSEAGYDILKSVTGRTL